MGNHGGMLLRYQGVVIYIPGWFCVSIYMWVYTSGWIPFPVNPNTAKACTFALHPHPSS